MKRHILGTILAILSLASGAAYATPVPTSVGVVTAAGTLDCAKLSNGGCAWHSANPSAYDTIGATTHTMLSGSSTASDLRGTAISSGEANLSSYLPTLHAYASSNGSWTPDFSALAGTIYKAGPNPVYYTGAGAAIADADVWAVQGYQYTGATPFTLTVTGTLDSMFSAIGQAGKVGHSGFSLSIFGTAGYLFNPDYYSPASLATICPILGNPSNICPPGGPTVFDHEFNTLYDSGTLSLTISHVLHPGDKFFVGAFLDASVCCGNRVDSSHTLNLKFNDFSQLDSIAVPGVVPEPMSILLMLTGLALMRASWRQRRRHYRPYQ